jgi:hypothetical protein
VAKKPSINHRRLNQILAGPSTATFKGILLDSGRVTINLELETLAMENGFDLQNPARIKNITNIATYLVTLIGKSHQWMQ